MKHCNFILKNNDNDDDDGSSAVTGLDSQTAD